MTKMDFAVKYDYCMRAVYHGSDVIMLDNVLSAVDVQVAQWILHNAILGPRMQGKTRLLCTHNIQMISSADMIVVMDKGHVKWMGSSADFPISSYTAFSPLNEMDSTLQNHIQPFNTNSSLKSKEQPLPDKVIRHAPEEPEEELCCLHWLVHHSYYMPVSYSDASFS